MRITNVSPGHSSSAGEFHAASTAGFSTRWSSSRNDLASPMVSRPAQCSATAYRDERKGSSSPNTGLSSARKPFKALSHDVGYGSVRCVVAVDEPNTTETSKSCCMSAIEILSPQTKKSGSGSDLEGSSASPREDLSRATTCAKYFHNCLKTSASISRLP